MIEACAIAIPGTESRRPYKKVTICPIAGADIGCFGFSDSCKIRDNFIPRPSAENGERRPKEEITFTLPPPEHLTDPVLSFQRSVELANRLQFPT